MRNEALMSQREAARYLGLSERTLEAHRLRRTGPRFVRISKRCVRYRGEDLDSFVDAHTVATSTPRVPNGAQR